MRFTTAHIRQCEALNYSRISTFFYVREIARTHYQGSSSFFKLALQPRQPSAKKLKFCLLTALLSVYNLNKVIVRIMVDSLGANVRMHLHSYDFIIMQV